MAKPGTEVTTLENPVIGFGGAGGAVKQKYGGYPYSLDFSLSLMDPSRISISFISEDRTYDTAALMTDIETVGTKGDPTEINYCGGGNNVFYGFPMKYSINRSPRGDILTVDYYDASIAELDNTFVLLNEKDFPNISAEGEGEEEAGGAEIPLGTVAANPCPPHLFILGRKYTQNAAGIPQSNPACIDEQTLNAEVLYSNHELAEKISEHITVDANTIGVLSPQAIGQGGKAGNDPGNTFLEAYHGTLREVLKQWGQRMGFTFYWDPKPVQGQQDQGRLVFIDLKGGLFFDELKDTVEKMLGKTQGGACNLLDSTEAVSREQTFNKAISARYENAGIGDSVQTDRMMILDLLTLPIRGCVTDVGKDYPKNEYDRGIKTNDGDYSDGSPQYRWTAEDPEWYKEWDSPNYDPDPAGGDPIERVWMEYYPERPEEVNPNGELGDIAKEYRDYIRLVKAAAIGEDFFKAYVFFKAMKTSNQEEIVGDNTRTLWDAMQERPMKNDQDPKAKTCEDTLRELKSLNYSFSVEKQGGGRETIGAQDNELQKKCCGNDVQNIELTKSKAQSTILVPPNAGGVSEKGIPMSGDAEDPGILVPDLVENKALTKILSFDADGNFDEHPKLPNVRICRGTVLGADCLSVNALDPSFKATKNLYAQLHGNPKTGCDKNSSISVDSVDESGDVYRVSMAPGEGQAEKNGSPYIFTYVFNYGNSLILDSGKHAQLYKQLSYVAQNAGRFWVSHEPLTEREYNQRSYDEQGTTWVNKLLDVNDTVFRGLFQVFDPTAPRAFSPFSNEEARYSSFWGTKFSKGDESSQKQLNGFSNLEPPEEGIDNPCGYDQGGEFSPSTTETGENTRAPNIEQMIEKIIDKNLNGSTGIPCRQDATFAETSQATMEIGVDGLDPVLDDEGLLVGYQLKPIYYAPRDFFGGKGYGKHPEITIDGVGVGLSIKTIIDKTSISQIIIENFDDFSIIIPADGKIDITVSIGAPDAGTKINFFNHIREGEGSTAMSFMDSITSTNLSKRQEQRALACCCTDLEEGIVFHDIGEVLIMDFNTSTQKQIQRLADATNLTLGSQFQGNLVKDYELDNKLITMSTNLIPISKLDKSFAPDAEDELDWIVDQVRLGKINTDPSYQTNGYVMPVTAFPDSGLAGCEMDTKPLIYTLRGNKFEMVAFGMPVEENGAPNGLNWAVKTVPGGINGEELVGCNGFMGDPGVNVREMKIDFETPTSEDIGIEFECGKEWTDLDEGEQQDLLMRIRENVIEYVKKRAYLQGKTSYEASVTIADTELQTSKGGAVDFGNNIKGIPSIEKGLESLSIKVDGNGIKVTISVGTRKKLLGLRDPNTNLWREMNPRILNQMQMNNPGDN